MVSVTFWAALVAPTGVLGKVRLAGETLTIAGGGEEVMGEAPIPAPLADGCVAPALMLMPTGRPSDTAWPRVRLAEVSSPFCELGTVSDGVAPALVAKFPPLAAKSICVAPIPVSATVSGPVRALSVTVKVAVRGPGAEGVNVTVMRQSSPAASVFGLTGQSPPKT